MWEFLSKMLLGHEKAFEYIEKFILPTYEEGVKKGVPENVMDIFVEESISESEYPSPLPTTLLKGKVEKYLSNQV